MTEPKIYTQICKCALCGTQTEKHSHVPYGADENNGIICDNCENNLSEDDWTNSPKLIYKKEEEIMREPRKFYNWRTQIYEQLTDEPNKDLDANIRTSMSRGMAELIAKLLTEHFEKEQEETE